MARRAGVSLGTKLVAGTVILLAAAVATSAWYGLQTMKALARASGDARRADLEAAIQREATLLTRNAAASFSSLLGSNDYTQLEETTARIADENADLRWIVLVGTDGKVSAASKGAPKQAGEVYADELTARLADATISAVVQATQGEDQLLLGAPVYLSGDPPRRVGEVRLAVDTSTLARARDEAVQDGARRTRESRRQQLLFAGIILVVGILLGTFQGWRIARPLRALTAQARKIAGGDFGSRVAVGSNDEVGELGHSFNIMAESLGKLVDELTRKAGLEREVELARSIQGLMTPPPDVMSLGSFKLTGRCEMAEACGGDWWSYRTLSDGRLLVVVGDVTGHGMPSAMIAATGRGAVEALAVVDQGNLTPKLVLQAIDRAIRDVGGKRLRRTSLAQIRSPVGHVEFANAGHTFPYVMSRRPGATGPESVDLAVLPVRSNPLGSTKPLIATGEHQLGAGDYMVLMSDGLTDRIAAGGARFGDKRLRRTLVDQVRKGDDDIGALCERVVGEVNEFGGDQPVDDDITLVVVQYTGSGADRGNRLRRDVAA